jgi:hypothetical protein
MTILIDATYFLIISQKLQSTNALKTPSKKCSVLNLQ